MPNWGKAASKQVCTWLRCASRRTPGSSSNGFRRKGEVVSSPREKMSRCSKPGRAIRLRYSFLAASMTRKGIWCFCHNWSSK